MASVLRIAARSAVRARQFSTTSVARKDIVQDIYVQALKAYKPSPQAQDAQLGAVKHFSTPSAPHAPALPSDLAGELAAYDAADPVRAPVKADAAAAAVDAAPGGGADEFLEMLAADEPEHGAHH